MLSHTTNFSRTQSLGKNPRFVPSVASHSLNGTLDMMGAPMSFARNSEIYGKMSRPNSSISSSAAPCGPPRS